MVLNIVPRSRTGLRPPKWVIPLTIPVSYVLCMETHCHRCGDEASCARQIQFLGLKETVLRDIAADVRQNFLIGGDGRIYEGRGWGVQPYLPVRYKFYSGVALLIGYIGRFYTLKDVPGYMIEARDALIQYGMEKKYIMDSILRYNINPHSPYKNV